MNMQDQVIAYLSANRILKKDFAKKIDVSNTKLSHWFAGNVVLDQITIEKIKAIIE